LTKLHPYIFLLAFTMLVQFLSAQSYGLRVRGIDRDSAWIVDETGLKTSYADMEACRTALGRYLASLHTSGYITASMDSMALGPKGGRVVLYIGEAYEWAILDADQVDPRVLLQAGWKPGAMQGKRLSFDEVGKVQERILRYYENHGHPFARVYLDSLSIDNGGKVSGKLRADPGPLYHIDSIRVYGEVKINSIYLQRYLDIPNGSIYEAQKLDNISRKIRELTYLEETQPSTLSMLGTGSVINLYLRQKKSSQVNLVVGFLPNNDQLSSKKLLLTGEANILLRNAFGAGETVGLNWQQLQVKSPRLNLLYQHPYILQSPFGLDFNFEMFRKDSSFLNVQFQLGGTYSLNQNQAGKVFIQRSQTILSQGGIPVAQLIQTRRLPDIADVSSLNFGVEYEFNTTDYRFNPRTGMEWRGGMSIGTKRIKKNNEIVELKDPGDPSFDFETLYDDLKLKTYQLRFRLGGARYLPLGRQSTLKLGVQGGYFHSGNIFRNELFQVGGYRLLRGFDEESQYLKQFAIATVEYRLLYVTGLNSFFYALLDGGVGQTLEMEGLKNRTYFGTGLGLAFETGAGIFNLAWAIGKRDDTNLDLRKSKIHFGFVNYF
jgi:outer membrane protein assembly factor BamA